MAWPPRSPDLTLCNFSLWDYVKNHIYVPPLPATLNELSLQLPESFLLRAASPCLGANYTSRTHVVFIVPHRKPPDVFVKCCGLLPKIKVLNLCLMHRNETGYEALLDSLKLSQIPDFIHYPFRCLVRWLRKLDYNPTR